MERAHQKGEAHGVQKILFGYRIVSHFEIPKLELVCMDAHTDVPKGPNRLDLNQLAKRIVEEATGEAPIELEEPEKDQATAKPKRHSGSKGGIARAAKLTPEQRIDAARVAANSRWKKAT